MKNYILIILNLIYLTNYSQTAIIKVVDSQTNEPLPFVNICFESLISEEKKYTTTSINGVANNYCTKKCAIALSFVGYKTHFDTIKINQSRMFKLTPDVFNLEQVTVTGTRTSKHLKDAPVITQVITAKDIATRGLTSVSEVLEDDIPSIEFQQAGFGTAIQMQGLDANYILFLIDGERMAGETDGNIDFSRLNTENIERIEIIKGAASALYGSQAMGGVINIISKNPRKKIEISVSSKFKQYNNIDYSNLQTNADNFYFKQNIDRPNLNETVAIGFNIKNFSSRTDFVLNSSDAYQLFDSDYMLKQYSNIDTAIYELPNRTDIDGFEDYSISQKFNYKFSNKLSINVKGSYYNHNQYDYIPDNNYKKFIDVTVGGNIKYYVDKNNSIVASYNTDTYNKYMFNEVTNLENKQIYSHILQNPRLIYNSSLKKHIVTTGTEFIKESLSSEKFIYEEYKQHATNTYIAFIQDDIKISEKFNIIAGLRADNHSAFGFHLSPKISAMYKYSNFTLRTNYANGFRSPTLKELYMDWEHLGMFTIKGNNNLKPETNNYFSLSNEYSINKFNGSVTIYHNVFKNKIEGQWLDNQTVYQYINIREFQLSGLDISLKYNALKNLNILGGYSFLYDNNTVNGMKISTVSPHTANIRFEYKLRKGIYNASFNFSGKIYGAKNFDISEDIFYRGETIEGTYTVNYKAYSMWKFTITQNFYNSVNLIIGVDNIFDYKANIITFNTSTTPGRRFLVALNIGVDRLYNYVKGN